MMTSLKPPPPSLAIRDRHCQLEIGFLLQKWEIKVWIYYIIFSDTLKAGKMENSRRNGIIDLVLIIRSGHIINSTKKQTK